MPRRELPSKGTSVTKWRTEACKRSGSRHAIFTPNLSSQKMYKGEWRDDEKWGKGTELDIRAKLLYEGDWSKGERCGFGELAKIMPDRSRVKVYSGNWRNNMKDGFGRLWYKNGGYYEGDFSANSRHGFGRLWRTDGTFYQGTWKNNLYHGEGMLVLANGNRFEGYFTNGRKEGRGIFYHMNTGQLQDGCWHDDKCISSTMEDIYWRQSSPTPTFYPIPKNGLPNLERTLRARIDQGSSLHDPDLGSFSTKYKDYVRARSTEQDCNE